MFIDNQQPSTGSISVSLITKYTIDSVLSVYHIMILLHITIYITISIYSGSSSIVKAATSKLAGSNHKSDNDDGIIMQLTEKNPFSCMILNPRAGNPRAGM